MKTIKSGSYRFNDYITNIGSNREVSLNFKIENQRFSPDDVAYMNSLIPEYMPGYPTITVDTFELNMTATGFKFVAGTTDDAIIGTYEWYHISILGADRIVTPSTGSQEIDVMIAEGAFYINEIYHSNNHKWHERMQDIIIPEDQEVDDEFYAWFTKNAAPVVSINYNGRQITIESGSGDTAVLNTKDKKLKSDIKIISAPVFEPEAWDGSFTIIDDEDPTQEPNEDPTVINFTISGGTPYQAEEGMTWEQWVNSEYNTGGYYVSGSIIYANSVTWIVNNSSDNVPEKSSNEIMANANYATSHSMGGGN